MAFGVGEFYASFAAVIWVIGTLLSVQYLSHVPIGIFLITRSIVGAIVFAAIVVVLFGAEHFQDVLSPFLWKWMLVYGGIIIVVGQLLWYKGISMTNASQVSLASSFTPVAGVIFAVVLLGETPNMAIMIGGAVIVLGIAVAQLGPVAERRLAPSHRPTTDEAVKLEGSVNFKGV
jgi:drug/metabolite transporter (DMT)-like permease